MEHDIVIVNGSSSIKAGFSGGDVPMTIFSNLVGKPQYPAWLARFGLFAKSSLHSAQKTTFIGKDAQTMRDVLSLQYPMERGVIQNWDAIEEVWRYTFNELKVKARDHRVLMTEAPLNPSKHRAQMFEIMFETFQVPAFYVETPAWLVWLLSSNRRKSGLILHVGDSVTHTLAVFEGSEIPTATQRANLGGRDVTKFLSKLLLAANSSSKSYDQDFVKEIKEERCYVSRHVDRDDELASTVKEYELSNGQTISLGSERFKCHEALFRPLIVGLETEGVHDVVLQSFENCELTVRRELLKNVVICGGATVAAGFPERLRYELKRSLPNDTDICLQAHPERGYSSWIGGSAFCNLLAFNSQWITRQEYNEFGSDRIIHQKASHGQLSYQKVANNASW